MNTESELEAKYSDAVKRWEAAKEATVASRVEKDEKEGLANEKPWGTRESYLAWADGWKARIEWVENSEQEYSAEHKMYEAAVNLMIHEHGADSKEVQIAVERRELTSTKVFVWYSLSPYWTTWAKLNDKASMLYNQLNAKGCVAVADELGRRKDEFHDRINTESNGEALCKALNAAVKALDKWEKQNDCTAWDEAKSKYDAELKKWKEFQ
ncbi:uncharacterized protein TM35_000601000, partial [Trypanosoma theileri]